jgi:hypothetical protein
MKEQLKQFINKPCWFKEGILEIRKRSDGVLIEVSNEHVLIKNEILGHLYKIPISSIISIKRNDLV